jgi:hypothetical protein
MTSSSSTTGAARREVLDRLLALNHERYAEEVKQGLHDRALAKAKKASGPKRPRSPASLPSPQGQLAFDLEPAPEAGPGRGARAAASDPSGPQPQTSPDTPAPDARLAAVLDCVRTSGQSLSKAEILAATGLDESLWPKLLAQLRDAGQIVQQGQKRGTRYTLPAAEGA